MREKYAAQLAQEGVVDASQIEADAEAAYQHLTAVQQAVKSGEVPSQRSEDTQRITPRPTSEPTTAVSADVLKKLNLDLLAVPDGFQMHPKLQRQLERRRDALTSKEGVEWAHAESLAFASLLVEGTPLRLTGQDSDAGVLS